MENLEGSDSERKTGYRRKSWLNHTSTTENTKVGRLENFLLKLVGGNSKICLCSSRKLGEIIQFDDHIFQMGWFNHQPENRSLLRGHEPLVFRDVLLGAIWSDFDTGIDPSTILERTL